jgi:hypothetical protein
MFAGIIEAMRRRATKFYRFRLIVEGTSHFPIDMLRYDNCVPASEEATLKIERGGTGRRIELICYSQRAISPSTPSRWASFGWKVVSEEHLP